MAYDRKRFPRLARHPKLNNAVFRRIAALDRTREKRHGVGNAPSVFQKNVTPPFAHDVELVREVMRQPVSAAFGEVPQDVLDQADSELEALPSPAKTSTAITRAKPNYTPRKLGGSIKPITARPGNVVDSPGRLIGPLSARDLNAGKGFGDSGGIRRKYAEHDMHRAVLDELKKEIENNTQSRLSSDVAPGGELTIQEQLLQAEAENKRLKEEHDATEEDAGGMDEDATGEPEADEHAKKVASIAERLRRFLAKSKVSTNNISSADPYQAKSLLESQNAKLRKISKMSDAQRASLGDSEDGSEEERKLENFVGNRTLTDQEKQAIAGFAEQNPEEMLSQIEDMDLQAQGKTDVRKKHVPINSELLVDEPNSSQSSSTSESAKRKGLVISPFRAHSTTPADSDFFKGLEFATSRSAPEVEARLAKLIANAGKGGRSLPPMRPNTREASGSVERVGRPVRASKQSIQDYIASKQTSGEKVAPGTAAQIMDRRLSEKGGKPELDPDTWMPVTDTHGKGEVKGNESKRLRAYQITRTHPVQHPPSSSKPLSTEKPKGKEFFPSRPEKSSPLERAPIATNTTGLFASGSPVKETKHTPTQGVKQVDPFTGYEKNKKGEIIGKRKLPGKHSGFFSKARTKAELERWRRMNAESRRDTQQSLVDDNGNLVIPEDWYKED